ncbi:hypothetical protein LZ30DRAFT_603949 [Colletotrichum cereale]|nr:hypothetical protein LZ30DRAFT_603949 [Colletotrichum cereale]
MADVDEAFARRLAREGWSLYALGMFSIVLRMLGGVRYYRVDDYLEILAALLYTLLLVSLNLIVDQGGSNLVMPSQVAALTPADVAARVTGSKIVLVSEQAMLNVIYTLKACVLILYTRLTLGLAAQRFVRYLAVYVAVGWVATQTTMFAACRPFAGYWAVPPPDAQCATYERYAILQAWFNISSDVLMLLVPLPLVFRMDIARRQKAVLVFVFSLGVCVIVAALLTKIFNLRDPYSPGYMLWYIREASVAFYVSNLPLVWPLLREWFPWLRSMGTPDDEPPTPRSVGRAKAVHGSTAGTMTGNHPPGPVPWTEPLPPMATARRDRLSRFGHWLKAGDLELQRPPARRLPSPSSQRRILSERAGSPEGSPRKMIRQRRTSLPEAYPQGWDSAELSRRRQTMELDLERGLYSCYGPGEGLYPEPKETDASPTKQPPPPPSGSVGQGVVGVTWKH